MRWAFLHLFVRFCQQSINPLALGGRRAAGGGGGQAHCLCGCHQVISNVLVLVPGQADQALPGPEMASPVFRAKRKGHVDPTMVSLSKFKTKQMVPSTRREQHESSEASPCGREKNCHSFLNMQSGTSLERLNF